MSLLMEALRKAEEAKRRVAKEQEGETAAKLTLETPAEKSMPAFMFDPDPVPEHSPAQVKHAESLQPNQDPAAAEHFAPAEITPDSSQIIPNQETQAIPDLALLANERLADELTPTRTVEKVVAEPRQRETVRAGSISSRNSARAIFAAKTSPSSSRTLILSSVLGLMLLLGLGIWFLIPMFTSPGSQFNVPASYDANADQSFDSPADDAVIDVPYETVIADATETTVPVETTSDPIILSVTVPAVTAASDLAEPTFPAPEIQQTAVAAAVPVPAAAPALSSTESLTQTEPALLAAQTVAVAATNTPDAPGASNSPVISPAPSSPIQITRSSSIRNPDMQMLSAWSAYQQGDYAAASILYQRSLALNPDNRDALLGAAASALQQGDTASARQAYTHLLNMNPRDPLARTGLLETTASNDPMQREIDLKALLTNYPDVAAVSYSLGNLYAGQQRWHDAQQSYYNALLIARTQATGPVSPDYAFNLAISLERINQPQAALNFYREARTLSEQHAASFDQNILDQRLQALERTLP